MAKLYFYYSAMNAGKSTTLLQSSFNYRERGMNTLVFTAAIDDRYGNGVVKSRIGLELDAVLFDAETNLYKVAKDACSKEPLHCILVDEAQFLNKEQVWQLTEICDTLQIPVLTYGLRTDFQANLFEGSKHLLALADELKELKTICTCGSKATMNLRIDEHGRAVGVGEQKEIGGNDRYISLCRKHFMEKLNEA
ncbi:MAG: thymidine kinase [Sphingomonadales bacterium]|nr:thymidine kinase [Sphingomonadales bacterium]